MPLILYNTLTRQKELFTPLTSKNVRLYVCGPTVYDFAHIGNARPYVIFDVLSRLLRSLYPKVTYVRNITDVDDKIINRAIDEGKTEKEIAEYFTQETKKLFPKLNVKTPDVMPKATDYIDDMVNYIDNLIQKGYAYEHNGDVYFRVSKIRSYGEISRQNIDKLFEGARIEVSDIKEDPKDFNLWKKTDVGIAYDSKWSKGRPGWHTECAVMNHEIFNQELDIHGGGIDLKFPHHENENAQSIAHNGHGLSKYWMHSAFINLTDTKMSKSLGNVISVIDLEKDYDLIAYRLLVLAHHYQQPINYSDELMKQYQDEYNKIYRALKNAFMKFELANYEVDEDLLDKPSLIKFYEEMNQNLNTPNAITVVYELVKSVNKKKDLTELGKYYNSLIMILKILGFDFEFKKLSNEDRNLFNKWNEARSQKDFQTADKYRALLQEKGLI